MSLFSQRRRGRYSDEVPPYRALRRLFGEIVTAFDSRRTVLETELSARLPVNRRFWARLNRYQKFIFSRLNRCFSAQSGAFSFMKTTETVFRLKRFIASAGFLLFALKICRFCAIGPLSCRTARPSLAQAGPAAARTAAPPFPVRRGQPRYRRCTPP